MAIPDIMMKHREQEIKYGREFKKHFARSLHAFMDYITGFDVIAFDEFLKTPDGISTHDWIIKEYGQDACDLIEKLLK